MKTIEQIKDELKSMKAFYESPIIHSDHKKSIMIQIITLEWVLDASIS